jgi:hypothetical protein
MKLAMRVMLEDDDVGVDPDQSWGSDCSTPGTFHPATVPLQTTDQVVPSKYANAELMKIPNFLHLTPPTALGAGDIEGH